ncbi:hypothetical protein B0H63DRAFT_440707 [Podospora didyma]|uniref:BRCT domain-containing protein n=1 Tax=Podospora didyma TaxID=330526 RepID=A0AAE0K621_9PEZI|nr:hypothetical protein B0H63DRAFT_440707 [Podospora didyma]
MTRSASIRKAELKALNGENESQDSLQVIDIYMKKYGIGITSSSPVLGEATLPVATTSHLAPSNETPPDHELPDSFGQETREVKQTHQIRASSISAIQDREALADCDFDKDGDAATNAQAAKPSGSPPRKSRKMDSSQSPTQSNDGRSYDRYDNCRTSSPGHQSTTNEVPHAVKLTRSSPGEQPRTLDEDDTDNLLYNFDDPTPTAKTKSSIQDDSGFVDFGTRGRLRSLASDQQDSPGPQQFPETPAPPKNPFRHGRSQLLAPSQLFGGTQFSSAVKQASPTSSRPSPADFNNNSISPNVFISSPLKARGIHTSPIPDPTSSPQILPGTSSSQLNNEATSPVNTSSTKTAIIPDSSHCEPQRKKSGPQPMGTYEPMRKSQERRSTSGARSDSPDGEEDDSIPRRMKVKSRKEAALDRLKAISFARTLKSDDIEVPSTSKGKSRSVADDYLAQCHEEPPGEAESDPLDTVADSQEHRVQTVQHQPSQGQESTQSDLEEDQVPDADPTPRAALDVPTAPRSPTTEPPGRYVPDMATGGDAIPETSPAERRLDLDAGSLPPLENPLLKAKSTPDFQSSPPAFSTRSKRGKTVPGSRVPRSSSTLSKLVSTPSLTSSTTPATEDSVAPMSVASTDIISNSSPARAKSTRRSAPDKLPKLKTGSVENLRHSARLGRRLSESPDELFAATPTFEQSLRASRNSTSKLSRSIIKNAQTQRGTKLFEGMAFAISFQSKRPGEKDDHYNSRMDSAATIERKIKQAGGRILEIGFDELFEALPVRTASANGHADVTPLEAEPEIGLTSAGKSTGFTALIADGHSRKVKYIQALALGLPCIACRWITSCLDRNELLDWTPYLLCAGQSTFLGDAIRSRNLTPYDASTAKLADVIDRRTKFLEGGKILLVMKKSVEGKKMAYVFLARVLGASLSRVYNIDEAKQEMKAAEDSGHPFDWVYVDGKSDQGRLFAPSVPSAADGKKRKRASTASVAEPPSKRVRTLSDELVIQSLILGRLIEEGEMED